jgi:GDP-4-dehydro-6-deoxy-D-mannose reductase
MFVDITSFESTFSLISKVPEIIINATGVFKAETPEISYKVNYLGSINLFESILKISNYTPKILTIGSAAEYGSVEPSALLVKETQPLKPVDHYAISKASQTFNALSYFKKGLDIYIGRPFNGIQPRLSDSFVLSSFARQIAEIEAGKKKPVISVGNLAAKRDFINIFDLVTVIWMIIEKGRKGEIYNICSGHSQSIGNLLDMMLHLSRTAVEIQIYPGKIKSADIPDIYGDYGKLQEDTGWFPAVSV